MERISFSREEMERMAARIGLPLDDASQEATRVTVEGWLNDFNDLMEEMSKPAYDGVIPADVVSLERGR